ncbi:MAG: heme ABC exporter ATP-binding protein CcmA [Hellea sp.]|nr:heme ABC exporter ATP-binding protein CcmA [Hellea sp.]
MSFASVTLDFGDAPLFSDLSLSVQPGQLIWLQGKNGTGKTSILRLSAGLLRPLNGILSHELAGFQTGPEKLVSYQSHKDSFEPVLTVGEELSFWAELYDYTEPIIDLLHMIGLKDQLESKIQTLSAGQKRRLSMARLLMADRPLWLLDEPKAGLDFQGQELIETLIANHLNRGGAAMVASHNPIKIIGRQVRKLLLETRS